MPCTLWRWLQFRLAFCLNYLLIKETDMKKIFAINLVVILLLSLTACDSSTQTSTNSQQSAPSSSDITEAPVTEQLAEQPPIIERSVLFGNPLRFQGRLSPDGTKMSFRAPLNGVMNLWVGDRGDFSSVKAITEDTGRGIPSHFWAWQAYSPCHPPYPTYRLPWVSPPPKSAI